MPTLSYWNDTGTSREFPSLSTNLEVDAAVIGGGNTGIAAAYLLKQAGMSVALFERDRCAHGDTGHTTAHLTHVSDLRLQTLVDRFGKDHAQAAWDAGSAGIHQIEEIMRTERINCEFARVPGYLHAAIGGDGDERDDLREEAELANELGFPATYVDSVSIFNRPGICFPNQARFHPVKYLAGLLKCISDRGCHVFEQTEVTEFADNAQQFTANGHAVTYGFVFIATDVPLRGRTGLMSATLLQTKIAPYTSYVIGAKVPSGTVPDGLFWDTSDPYYYLRLERDHDCDYVIFGGSDHKTGQESSEKHFQQLAEVLHQVLPHAEVKHRWSGQVIEAVDGLPLIGESDERQFVATGFSGNGLTFGTVGALMARDAALGRKNPWQDLFDVRRKKLSTLWNYVRENSDYPYYMLKDRLKSAEGDSLDDVKPGEGKILSLHGKRVAVVRDAHKNVTMLSSVCPHMGCLVNWNQVESTWDCPCHGSRFRATGEVFAGPAETPLAPAPSE